MPCMWRKNNFYIAIGNPLTPKANIPHTMKDQEKNITATLSLIEEEIGNKMLMNWYVPESNGDKLCDAHNKGLQTALEVIRKYK